MAYSGSYQSSALPPSAPETPRNAPPRPFFRPSASGKGNILSVLTQKMKAIDLEGDDLLMLLILYLMYRESGDKDLLIMMGAMLLG